MNNNFDFSQWANQLFNNKELNQFKKIMEKFSPSGWEEYGKQWKDMFKKIEQHLNIDPKSKEARSLYEEWMALVNRACGDHPEVQHKLWEAYKAGIKMNMQYFNQKVIDFIDQVENFYKVK